jgi:hypothetical protein
MLATPAVAAPGTGPRTLLVAGQSLAMSWAWDPTVIPAFIAAADGQWSVKVVGKGGSFARYRSGAHCWLSADGGNGPVLSGALAEVKAMASPPAAVLWSQGQADGLGYHAERTDPAAFVVAYTNAVLKILLRMRKAAAGRKWRRIPVFIQTIGWRADETGQLYEPPGYGLVRLAQMRMVAYEGRRHNLHMGPVQVPWAPLKDPVHPTSEHDQMMAQMMAVCLREAGI